MAFFICTNFEKIFSVTIFALTAGATSFCRRNAGKRYSGRRGGKSSGMGWILPKRPKNQKNIFLFKFGFQDVSKNLKLLRKLSLKSAVFRFFFLLNLSKRKWHDCG